MPSRAQIADRLVKTVVEVLGDTSEEEVRQARVLEDLAMCSIEVVEVMARMMRELQIKVPGSALLNVQSLDDLVDVIQRYVEQAHGAPPAE